MEILVSVYIHVFFWLSNDVSKLFADDWKIYIFVVHNKYHDPTWIVEVWIDNMNNCMG